MGLFQLVGIFFYVHFLCRNFFRGQDLCTNFFSLMIFGDLVMVTLADIILSQSYSSHSPQSDCLEQV